jgi:hypothetical protein
MPMATDLRHPSHAAAQVGLDPHGQGRRSSLHALLAGAGWCLGAATGGAHAAAPSVKPDVAQRLRVLTAWEQGETAYAGVWSPGVAPRGIALPARAHELLPIPATARLTGAQALVLARRPGEYLMRMDLASGRALRWHDMEEDRYLAGHACATADKARFFTTETDGETGAGLIVERDWRSLEKVREFASHGIGPHALCTLASGDLLVANGGILNLPESGRRKLNIGRMAPNLCLLDAASGAVRDLHMLDDPFLSLRHLAVAPDGTVAVAMQAEHANMQDRARAPALALLRDGVLRTVAWDNGQAPPAWDGYAGDVCCAQGRFWISAPHAGWLASWSLRGDSQRVVPLRGVGALAAMGGQVIAGGETQALLVGPDSTAAARYRLPAAWDNHAAIIGGRSPRA